MLICGLQSGPITSVIELRNSVSVWVLKIQEHSKDLILIKNVVYHIQWLFVFIYIILE